MPENDKGEEMVLLVRKNGISLRTSNPQWVTTAQAKVWMRHKDSPWRKATEAEVKANPYKPETSGLKANVG